jgi:hypothetical protein
MQPALRGRTPDPRILAETSDFPPMRPAATAKSELRRGQIQWRAIEDHTRPASRIARADRVGDALRLEEPLLGTD